MEEISIVKRRTRIWPVVLLLILIALVVLAVLWMAGYFQPAVVNVQVAPAASIVTALG
jgi:ABC-type transporter Mla subunit MlaD